MKAILRQMEHHVFETLGVPIAIRPWEKRAELPHYLHERYDFFVAALLGHKYIVMMDKGDTAQTPATVAKHLAQVQIRAGAEVIFVSRAVTSYNRKRLIQKKVPFIIPGNQLYLPMLGIDLREHLRRIREKKPSFSPATQVVLLHVLWHKERGTVTPSRMAAQLGYTAMTMTRAFDELEEAGIGQYAIRGKERQLRLTETGRALWEKVLPRLATPVQRKRFLSGFMPAEGDRLAGQGALARYSLLASPDIPAYAVHGPTWKNRVLQEAVIEVDVPEPGDAEIQLWKYSPERFAEAGIVDRLSLFLSMRDDPDERVQGALETLLKEMSW
ncbi:MAG: hypothetical protein GXY07_17595 [Candidatus Hydrogenedentes bacterium]|nr:hypothetical protein [Candidatus Hydrogenedentota bacterium]